MEKSLRELWGWLWLLDCHPASKAALNETKIYYMSSDVIHNKN
jgi:hypothetical protein